MRDSGALDARMTSALPAVPGSLAAMPRRACLEVALVLAFAMTLAGCGAQPTPPSASAGDIEVVRISGSSAAMPLVQLLTDTVDRPGVQWHYRPSPGSRSGVEGVASGELEIGVLSRPLTAEEEATGLVYTPLSRDGLVIAVHPSTEIRELTTQQVRDIFSGVCTNWSELGGADLPIVVLDRGDGEPARLVMQEYVFGTDLAAAPGAARLYTDEDVVSGVESTVGAVGYFSLGYGISNEAQVSYPALDGVVPCVESIHDGSYRILRPLGVVTSADPSPAVVAFLEWATSEDAQELIENSGYAAVR